MEHEQKRHEKHEEERKLMQAEERQSEQRFSLLGPTVRYGFSPWASCSP